MKSVLLALYLLGGLFAVGASGPTAGTAGAAARQDTLKPARHTSKNLRDGQSGVEREPEDDDQDLRESPSRNPSGGQKEDVPIRVKRGNRPPGSSGR